MLSLYFHTIRHLKIRQILARLYYRFYTPDIDKAVARPTARQPKFTPQFLCRDPSLIGPSTFSLLHEVGELSKVGWDGPGVSKLWRYNQHYFDDLSARDSSSRSKWHGLLIENWIKENKSIRKVAWDPYPTSLRIVNWIKWSLRGNELSKEALSSLFYQVLSVEKRIEWHLMGNHVFSNAKALVFAGLFFEIDHANRWLKKGLKIIEGQLPEQVLRDGGHFELSPMYHSLFLEDLLDLINVATCFEPSVSQKHIIVWKQYAQRMISWLEAQTHPDGSLPNFNDVSHGFAFTLNELMSYAMKLSITRSVIENHQCNSEKLSTNLVYLKDSGYVRAQMGSAVAFFDIAKVGPNYIPGHAHADTLSFELSLFSKKVLINGGVSTYENNKRRWVERGTSSHNTVEINSLNSSETWSAFRVARRAVPFDLQTSTTDKSIVISCSHDGYKRLKGSPIHKREWSLNKSSLCIRDEIIGAFDSAISRLHFSPSIIVEPLSKNEFRLKSNEFRKKIIIQIQGGHATLKQKKIGFAFGKTIESKCLEISFSRQINPIIRISW